MNILTDEEVAILENEQLNSKPAPVQKESMPLGYFPIELSTQGKLGAPKKFNVRNFKTSDLVDLSLTAEDDLPETVARMLDGMIYEKDVSVKNFHEKEVIEFLVKLYMIFFANEIEVDFELNEDDHEYLKQSNSTEAYEKMLEDLLSGKWNPQSMIILSNVETYDIDEKLSRKVTIKSKKTDSEFTFSFPKFGDVIALKKALKVRFEKDDKRFASIKRMIQFQESMEQRYRNGEDIDVKKIPIVPEYEVNQYKAYEIEKAVVAIDLVRAVQIIGYNGKNLEHASIEEKLKIVNTADLDHIINTKLERHFQNLKFGIKPEIKMMNPITHTLESRGYSFRLVDILQAINAFESDEFDIVIDN